MTPEQIKELSRKGILLEMCSMLDVCIDHMNELPPQVQQALEKMMGRITQHNEAYGE